MGLHHRYYADDIDYSPTPRTQPYAEMQKQIGKILREQYQPPQELPHSSCCCSKWTNKAAGEKRSGELLCPPMAGGGAHQWSGTPLPKSLGTS